MSDNTSGIEIPPELQAAKFTLSEVNGIGRHPDITRLDASTILNIDGRYYVWYTRLRFTPNWLIPWNTANYSQVWLATSDDGWNWQDYGQVLEDSDPDAWHARGKHAPDVLFYDGRYYMYFSAHPGEPVHEKHIGVAIADKPEGPFKHVDGGPVLSPELDGKSFDARLIDDPCLIVRNGKLWLYYKGRTDMQRKTPLMIGLAIAETPIGPFVKSDGNPLVKGHTGCVWPHREGVALIGDVKPPDRALYYSSDGRHFRKAAEIEVGISDPGVFCPDVYDDVRYGKGVQWGLCQGYEERKLPADESGIIVASSFIVRWECDMRAPAD